MGMTGKVGSGVATLAMLGVAHVSLAAQQPMLRELPCTDHFGIFQGIPRETVRCGTVTVPQNRATPNDSRLMSVVLPVVTYASAAAKGTPLVFLAGGPGESAIDAAQRVLLETPLGQMLMR